MSWPHFTQRYSPLAFFRKLWPLGLTHPSLRTGLVGTIPAS
jgi:hypothetical protein